MNVYHSNPEGSAKAKLCGLLCIIVSKQGQTKQAAKEEIDRLKSTKDFGLNLTELVLNPNCELAVRQLAVTILNNYAITHWHQMSKDFQFPEISWKHKTKIKELLLNELIVFDPQLRKAIADIVIVIAYWDWPDNWPELIDVLVNYLRKDDECALNGGMLVLTELVSGLLDDPIPHVSSILLVEMKRIFQDKNQYTDGIQNQAVDIFSKIVFNSMWYEQPEFIQLYLLPAISAFSTKSILSWKSENYSNDAIMLKIKILQVFEILMESAPRYIANFLPNNMLLIWDNFKNLVKTFKYNAVNGGKLDGYSYDLLINLIKFIGDFINAEHRSNFIEIAEFKLSNTEWSDLQDSCTTLEGIQNLIISIEITEEEIQSWNDEVIRFFTAEQLTTKEDHGIRSKTLNLLDIIARREEGAISNGIITVITKYIMAENARRVNDNSGGIQNRWKSHEAILQTLCHMKKFIVSRKKLGSLCFDLEAFLENVILADLNNADLPPFLISHCLYFGGVYADQMPSQMASRFLEATSNCLREDRSPCTKISAANAVNLWYRSDDSNKTITDATILRSYVPELLVRVYNMIKDGCFPKVLNLVLETIASMASFHETFIAAVLDKIYSLIETSIQVIRIKNSDHSPWLNIFEELTRNQYCRESIQMYMIPEVVFMMRFSLPDSNDGIVPLKIARSFVQYSPQPMRNVLFGELFAASCRCIAKSDDFHTGIEGLDVLHTYLTVSAQQVVDYQNKAGKSGVQYILEAIVHLLNSEPHDIYYENICNIVILLIEATGDTLEENIDLLLDALLNRIWRSRKFSGLCRKLLTIYARLINIQFNIVFNFLSNVPIRMEKPQGLSFVISEGFCKKYNSFDNEDRKIVKLALDKLLAHGVSNQFSRLHQMTFKENVGIKIPLLDKIRKLIINEGPEPVNETMNKQEQNEKPT